MCSRVTTLLESLLITTHLVKVIIRGDLKNVLTREHTTNIGYKKGMYSMYPTLTSNVSCVLPCQYVHQVSSYYNSSGEGCNKRGLEERIHTRGHNKHRVQKRNVFVPIILPFLLSHPFGINNTNMTHTTYNAYNNVQTFELVKPRSSLNTTRHIMVHTCTYASKCKHSACIRTLSLNTLLLSKSAATVYDKRGSSRGNMS